MNHYPIHVAPLSQAASLARPSHLKRVSVPVNGNPDPRRFIFLSDADWLRVSRQLDFSLQEQRVVQGILAGQKLTALADDLRLGLGTVKTYSQRIYRKLHISTHCELALAVLCAHHLVSQVKKPRATNRRDVIPIADLSDGGGI